MVENGTKFNATLSDYLREVHCDCPKCGENSIILAKSKYSMPWVPYDVNLTWQSCTYRETSANNLSHEHFINFNYSAGVEPYFGYQLTHHLNIKGNPLSIFSPKHATDISEYIESENRPRPENTKWAMVNRLPKWLKLAKNRQIVLKALAKVASC